MEDKKLHAYAVLIVNAMTDGVARGFQDYAQMRAKGNYVSIKARDGMVARRALASANSVFTKMEKAGATDKDVVEALAFALDVDVK